MPADPYSHAVIALLASSALAAGLLASAARQPPELAKPRRIWARAMVMAPSGWLLLEWARDVESLAVAGKTLIIASFIDYLRALLATRGRTPESPWLLLPVVFVALASLVMLLVHPGQPMRTGMLSLLCGGVAAGTAMVAWSETHRRDGGNARMVAACFVACAAVLLARALLLFSPEGSAARELAALPAVQTLLPGGAMLAPAVASLGFVLMGSDRVLERFENLASTDGLTGLLTRAAFLERALHRVQSATQPCSVLVVDMDHFKRVNDTHGHATGDRALELAAAAMRQALRPGDLIGRMGGEEFAVLLPDTPLSVAIGIAGRLQQAIAGVDLVVREQPVPLSGSIGVSEMRSGDTSLQALLEHADQAMYEAKRAGRDRVHSHAGGLADEPA